jgi:hypothetical protein
MNDDGIRRGFDKAPVAFLALAQRLFRLLAVGDIADDH